MKKLRLPRISFNKARKTVLFLVVFLFVFSLGYFLGTKRIEISFKNNRFNFQKEIPQEKQLKDFSLFWTVWDLIEEDYFDKTKIDYSKMVYGAIEGMVSALGDPYTSFLPPTENKIVEEDLSGSFEGVGIQIGYIGTQLAVVTPLPETPAEKAGVKAGDFIIGIKDENKGIETGTFGMSLAEAVKVIRGKTGTKVTLTLLREDSAEPIIVDLVRSAIDVPTLILSFTGENESIAHVRLLKFGAETYSEWQKAVGEILKKQSAKAVILDLRGNPGGYMDGAVDIAAEFVDNNSLVVIEERGSGNGSREYRTSRIGLLKSMPMVILVNKGSASASEILAGALRDIGGYQVVGETTFGKGTIQEPLQIGDGAGLHLTVARWLTPSKYWVHDKGIEPDIIIEDDSETAGDEQLDKAVEILNQRI